MKLIKLNEQHYIVVDDSEIKENDWYWTPIKRSIEQCVKKLLIIKGGQNDVEQLKITHSTPIGGLSAMLIAGIRELSLSEVEEAINGYSVEKMVKEYEDSFTNAEGNADVDFKAGFKAHQKLVRDKLFTVEDIKNALRVVYNDWVEDEEHEENTEDEYYNRIIQSLPSKTKWDVTFDEQGKLKLI